MSREEKRYIGVDIGGTKCAVALGDADGNVLRKVRFATDACQETLDRITDAVLEMGKADSIGISCGGPLDSARGVICSPPNLPGWDEIPIVAYLSEKSGIPAYLCNDANACALAEWLYGAGKGCRNMIFLTFGTGMGAGLILDGKLYAGTSDMAGEIGHLRLSPYGPVGYGKIGSFEGFCSGGGIAQLGQNAARCALQNGIVPTFCPSLAALDSVSAKSVADAAKAGDSTALQVFDLVSEKLGEGLSWLIDLLNPERIVIGSIYERCQELLHPGILRVIERETLPFSRRACSVLPAALGDRIGDVAALAVAAWGAKKEKNV